MNQFDNIAVWEFVTQHDAEENAKHQYNVWIRSVPMQSPCYVCWICIWWLIWMASAWDATEVRVQYRPVCESLGRHLPPRQPLICKLVTIIVRLSGVLYVHVRASWCLMTKTMFAIKLRGQTFICVLVKTKLISVWHQLCCQLFSSLCVFFRLNSWVMPWRIITYCYKPSCRQLFIFIQ
jgi:hypothetical protein